MPTNFYSVTLDGSTNFLDVQGNTVSWDGAFLQLASFTDFSGDDLSADIDLTGNNWFIRFFDVSSGVLGAATIDDGPGGTGRGIGTLNLGGVDSVISLNTTFVQSINGRNNAASYDVTLGDAGANFINLRADTNRVETGSGFVGAISTGGVDTVHIYGGANSVTTGDEDDEIGLFGGFTGLVEAGSGNDLFGAVGGDGGRIWLGNGEDRAFLLDGFVDLLGTGNDNDTVTANGGNAKLVQLGGGHDTVTVTGGSRLNYVEAGDGNATVTVEAGSRIDDLTFSNGTHTVTAQGDGRIREISGDDSTLAYTADAGRTNLIDFWRSDTNINLGSGGADKVGLYSDQAQSHTLFSSGYVSFLEMGDGQTMNLTLANQGAGRVNLGDQSDAVVIRDGAGVASINTREGNDSVVVQNGAGVDFLDTREGNDGVSLLNDSRIGMLQTKDGADTVFIQNSFADSILLGNGDDRLTMVGNSGVRFTIEGEGGNDLLIGGNNDDTFNGGDGNDSFLGGKGFNEVTGGAGADRFGFRPEDDVFVITDFEQGVDQLILVNFAPSLTFDALTQGGFVFEDGNDLVIGTGSKGYILENTQLSDWSADDLGFLTI